MSGGVRKTAVLIPTIITIAVIVLAGTVILQQRQERSDRAAEAEEIGASYFSEVASFEADVQAELADIDSGRPVDAKKVIDEKLEQPPVLGPAPEGAESSKTYQAAVKASETVLDPYWSLSARLGRAAVAETFVKAADDALGTSRDVLLRHSLVYESGPLRNQVIPELNRALAEFRATEVPQGGADVAAEIDGAVRHLIDQMSVMADKADAGASYEFSFGSQYDEARQAVRNLAIQIDGDTAEALDRIAGDES